MALRSNSSPKRSRHLHGSRNVSLPRQTEQPSKQDVHISRAQPSMQPSHNTEQANLSSIVDQGANRLLSLSCSPAPLNGMEPNPEGIGALHDEQYQINSALHRRSCIHHGTDWLLSFKDRWMTPGDFEVKGAREKLEAKLQGQAKSTRSKPADCMSSEWTHIDVPLDRRSIGGKDYFLIRWKLTWTPEADIGNLKQVMASYRQQEKQRRTSSRVRQFNVQKWEGYMRVALLEQYLDD